MTYVLHLVVYFSVYAIAAIGLNLIVGYCGLLSLAHAAYFAIGGYTYALLSLRLGWGFAASTLTAILVAGVLSLALSLPSWRHRGDTFVLMSLAVQTFVFSIIYNWSDPNAELGTWRNLTNGSFGITGIPRPTIFGYECDTIASMAFLAVLLLVVSAALAWYLQGVPWGRLLVSLRDDELVARGLGKNVRLAKIEAIAVGCSLAGLAGAFYSSYVSYIDPSSSSLAESILLLSMLLVGGSGNLRGPILGAATLLLIPEVLRLANLPDIVAADVRLLAYGLLLLILVLVRPQGLGGEYRVQ